MAVKKLKKTTAARRPVGRLKVGDEIVVLTGKDKGRTGKILNCLKDGRVLVEGINMVSKHVRPNPNTNEKGGVVKKEHPLHHSNVALMNPLTNKADRVYYKTVDISDGRQKKVRVFKSNDETVDA